MDTWREAMDADWRMVGALRFARMLSNSADIPADIQKMILQKSMKLTDDDLMVSAAFESALGGIA